MHAILKGVNQKTIVIRRIIISKECVDEDLLGFINDIYKRQN